MSPRAFAHRHRRKLTLAGVCATVAGVFAGMGVVVDNAAKLSAKVDGYEVGRAQAVAYRDSVVSYRLARLERRYGLRVAAAEPAPATPRVGMVHRLANLGGSVWRMVW